ncbi:MAG: RHS repeat-associated core domain-containing protein [Pyrinomonadaceae bacterium]
MKTRTARRWFAGIILVGCASVFFHATGRFSHQFDAEASEQSIPRPHGKQIHPNLLLETAYGPQATRLTVNSISGPRSDRPEKDRGETPETTAQTTPARSNTSPLGTIFITGKVVDSGGLRLRGITVRAITSTGTELISITSSFGIYRFENIPAPETYIIRPVSKRYRFTARIITVTSDTSDIDFINEGAETPTANAGPDQIVPLPNTVPLNGSASGGIAPLTAAWTKVSGPGNVVFANPASAATTATITTQGIYILRLDVTDAATLADSDEVQVVIGPVESPPPPDPVTLAPPINTTVATNQFDTTRFLYTGPNAIQTGVAPGMIKAERVASFRGRVVTKGGLPIPNVKITVLNSPEFGQTLTRADGMFDLVVNGGGVLDVKYEKSGYIPVQRKETAGWQEYCPMSDVVMLPYDGNVSFVDLSSTAPIQMAQSGIITDSSGTRQSRLFFKRGTIATMRLPNGSTQALTTINVRATEFTTGANGPEAMPGDLPANSAYTYAVEYSLDEAVAASATETTFNQPVIQYNENFLNFPVGIDIPSGAYDRMTGQWVPSASGRVLKILSISGGRANLDINGNGQPATAAEYSTLGIDDAERQLLAALYPTNQSLWRVPLIHFSPWDSNWPYGPPPDSEPPGGDPPSDDDDPPEDACELDGCVIEAEGQTLGEEVSLVGSPFTLRYSSDRKAGRIAARKLTIPLSGPAIPDSLKRIEMTTTVAGRMFTSEFPAQPNQRTSFTWDGLDSLGRSVQGQQTATINIGFVYDGVYQNTSRFGYNGNGIPISANASRQEITLSKVYQRQIGAFDDSDLGLGGWSLDIHHFYDPTDRVLYEGNGKRRSAQTINSGITTVAGTGFGGYSGDNVPAANAQLFFPFSATAAPNGDVYISDSENKRVRKINADGIITTVVGTGATCAAEQPCGDGGQAANAQITFPTDVSFGADGSYFIFDARALRIRKVATNGIITTAVGNGQPCSDPLSGCGDGGPATDARLTGIAGCCHADLDAAPDGALYLTDSGNHRVRRVGTDGIITTIAGNGRTPGQAGCPVLGPSPVIATSACLDDPTGLTALADGSVYFVDLRLNRIFRVTSDGLIRVIAGDGTCGNAGDGGPALNATICSPHAIAAGPDDSLLFSDWNNARIRKIDASGIITKYAGTGSAGFSGDGGPATAAQIRQSTGVSLGEDGSIFIGDANNHRIRRISAALPGFTDNEFAVPSEDGTELFRFDATGRHLNTINTLTNATLFSFNYDSAGRLIRVVDGDNNTTTIERDASGNPTGILSPYNQRTTFGRDSNGLLSSITNPAGEAYQFTYNPGGLMLTERDPLGNTNTFTYDPMGRLVRDEDPDGGLQTLTRTDSGTDFNVKQKTALNRETTFQISNLANGDRERVTTLPSGITISRLERTNGTETTTDPDGSVLNKTTGGDPRWKLLAPITTNNKVTTPGGLNFDSAFTRAVTLSTPGDPLSLVSQTDSSGINGRTYTTVFTAANRTFLTTSPFGRQSITVVDGQNRPTQTRFANLNTVSSSYDARGRLSSVIAGTGADARTSSYAYNAAGFLSSSTDPLNQTTSFLYDLTGRVTQQMLPDSRVVAFGYNANGRVTSITPPGRPAHTIGYDPRGLVSSYTAPSVGGNSTTTYTFDLDRQISNISMPDTRQINYAYDAAGRIQAMNTTNGNYGFTYNATSGRLSSVTAPTGTTLAYQYDGFLPTRSTWTGPVSGNVGLTHDNSFRLASINVNGANSTAYTYDNDDLITAAGALNITRNAQNGLQTASALNNINDSTTYNGFAAVTNYIARFNTSPLYDVTYTYDKLGRITQKVETIGGATTTYGYGYDSSGRLRTVTLNNAPQPTVTYNYDQNSNRTSVNSGGNTTTAVYDAQDRLTQYGADTYTYSLNGDLQTRTGTGTTQFSYDLLGNLRTATLADATQIEYVIDGQNRRIGKRVNGVLTQGFLYKDQLDPIAELDSSNNVVSRFIYATRSTTPDYMVKGGITYRFIYDRIGSVRLVVDAVSGTVVQRIDYDEFGVVLADSNPGFQPFGFAGGIYDRQTGLTRFGARDYDATTGRWTAKDPTLFDGGDTNIYNYAANDPVNFIDPEGKDIYGPGFPPPDGYVIAPDGELVLIPPQFDVKSLYAKLNDLSRQLAEELAKKCPSQARIAEINKNIAETTAEIARRKQALQDFLHKYYPALPPPPRPKPPRPGGGGLISSDGTIVRF